MNTPVLVVHGGAGLIRRDSLTPEREQACRALLRALLAAGRASLDAGATAVQVVEDAVVALEESPLFNAGRGAVFGADGTISHDASIMDGATRGAGAVTCTRTVRNPIRLARAVMERTPHVLVAGSGAEALAAELGLEIVDPSFFHDDERWKQFLEVRGTGAFHLDHSAPRDDVYGTVGAVALDRQGHVAAATSTGGMVNKRAGRVGDSPVIGAGTFAWDRTCAVSGTGFGEAFLRLGVAGRVSARMELAGQGLVEAAEAVIRGDLAEIDGTGGVIAVDAGGRIATPFNTAGMFHGWSRGDELVTRIWPDE